MAPGFEIKRGGKTVAVGFTGRRLSAARGERRLLGLVARPLDWISRLAGAPPHRWPLSNHRLLPVEKALAFVHGLWCDARKLSP